jgi:hypothetical protein
MAKHGMSKSRTYAVWASMIQRCTNPKNSDWVHYGGRGIKVVKRWHSFVNFLKDMGEAPPGLEIDRINTNGNYTPKNCRWVTRRENALNKRVRLEGRNPKTALFNLSGTERALLADAAGVSEAALRHVQYGRRNMSADMAIRIELAASSVGMDVRREDLCLACGGCELARKARSQT